MDREARAAEILAQVRSARRPLPRGLWVAAIAVSLVCAGGLAIAWIEERGAKPTHLPHAAARAAAGGGLGIGLVIGVAVGLVLGLALGLRRGEHQ